MNGGDIYITAQTMKILPPLGLIKRAKINNFQVAALRAATKATTYLFMIPITTYIPKSL